MNCETFRDDIFEVLRGTPADRAAFLAHRAACPACAALLEGIEANEKILAAARVPTAPADLWPAIAAAISKQRPAPVFRRRWIAGLAAAAALLLAVSAFFLTRGPSSAPRLDLVVQEVGPESQRAFRSLVPRYEDVDAATAMVDSLFRSDY